GLPLGRRIEYEGLPIYFFARFSPPIPAVREFAFSGAFTTWLWQNITKYDLVHVHALFSYTSTVAMAIASMRGVPYLTTAHGALREWSLQHKPQKKQAYLRLIERANIDRAAAIHVTCQQERDELIALDFQAPSFILPLALTEIPAQIPEAAQRLRHSFKCPDDEPIILFLSRLHYQKGLDYLIPALGRCRDRRFTLIVAGSGTPAYEAEVREMLATAQIADRTHMVGFVDGDRKALLLQGADLFALTSTSESFGMAVLEALVVETPVLVTASVGLATVVRDRDLGYVANLDIDDITRSLDEFFSDPNRARAIGARARQYTLSHYTWDKIAPALIAIYRSIIDRQPLPPAIE
uniref:glycosyltransferase n=1 Tax=Chamaesiphon sp. VAR_69_metabat_338 TaxID=2964704 RepID=UPI00286DEDE1